MNPSQRRKIFMVQAFAVILLIIGCGAILKDRKDAILQQSLRFIEGSLSSGTDLDIRIGEMTGSLWGTVQVNHVSIEKPWLPEGRRSLFRCRQILFRYDFWDMIARKLNSQLEVTLVDPEVRWAPQVTLRRTDMPFLHSLRQWALSNRDKLSVRIKNMTLVHGSVGDRIKGIDLSYENEKVRLRLPIRHLDVLGSDLSVELNAEGTFRPGSDRRFDALVGKLWTEGAVVNWSPVSHESEFEFVITREVFELGPSHLLGGFDFSGTVDFTDDFSLSLNLFTKNYPLAHLDAFFKSGTNLKSPGRLDLNFEIAGHLGTPRVRGDAKIHDSFMGRTSFKLLDLHLEGVYPLLRLENSKVILEDDTSMRLADQTVNVRELFKVGTYKQLIADSEQDDFVWGEWAISRLEDLPGQPEFEMQRLIGEKSFLHFKKFREEEERLDAASSGDMEVGFEYRLRAKDSLKFEFKDDEEFIGLERKLTF